MDRTTNTRSFAVALGAIAVLGLTVRLVAIYTHAPELGFSDPLYYYAGGRAIARGEWFVNAVQYFAEHTRSPSAIHPPLYTLYLGVASTLQVESVRSQQVATALLGTGTVAVVGIAARRITTARAGLLAAAMAAVAPNLWSLDRLLLSETMAGLVAAAIVWCGVAHADAPSTPRAFLLGALLALLALTRAEALLLFVLLAVPLVVYVQRRQGRRAVLRDGGAILVAAVVVLGPWIGFNLARFEEPTFISTNGGGVLADSYCAATFDGPKVGWWEERCLPASLPGDESQQDRALREQAFRFLRHHRGDVPRVVALRVGRALQVYRPWQTARLDGAEGRGVPAARAGAVGWFVLLPVGVAGCYVIAARRRPWLPVVSLVASSALTVAVFYGSPRFRLVGEVALMVAAGVALDSLGRCVHFGDPSHERTRRPRVSR